VSAKVPCKTCSAEILASTAEMTGGLCMPCKKGTRASMEAAKDVYTRMKIEEQKLTPFTNLWESLVRRVSGPAANYDRLSVNEKLVYAVNSLRGAVERGGLYAYFDNTPGSQFRDALAGLDQLGAHDCCDLVLRAKQILFGDVDPPEGTDDRFTAMKELLEDGDGPRPESDVELSQIDDEFRAHTPALFELITHFAYERGLIQKS